MNFVHNNKVEVLLKNGYEILMALDKNLWRAVQDNNGFRINVLYQCINMGGLCSGLDSVHCNRDKTCVLIPSATHKFVNLIGSEREKQRNVQCNTFEHSRKGLIEHGLALSSPLDAKQPDRPADGVKTNHS